MPAKVIIEPETIKHIKDLFDLEYGSKRIAKACNLTRSVVKRILKELNLDTSARKTPKRPFQGMEKFCRRCQTTKLIINFKLQNTGRGRMIYRYCIECEKEFVYQQINKYKIKKIQNDPSYLVNKRISDIINLSIKYPSDQSLIENILPYTVEQLRQHLQNQFECWMNWNNYGSYSKRTWNDNDISTWKWNLDHIRPKSEFKFNLITDETFLQCWNLNNLRPYSAKQNLLDGVNRTRHNKV